MSSISSLASRAFGGRSMVTTPSPSVVPFKTLPTRWTL